METFLLTVDEPLEFTVPAADGVMYCNGVRCYAEGKLEGPHAFVVGHRDLREAAQQWYAERVHLVETRSQSEQRKVLFWEKERSNAASAVAVSAGAAGYL